MQSPLILDIKHPKWIMANKILETIDSPRARKIAYKLKVYDVSYFLIVMKILVLSNLFERDLANLVSEINRYSELSSILKLNSTIKTQELYKYISNEDYDVLFAFFNRLFQVKKRKREQKQRTIIIDTTYIEIDLNLKKNRSKLGKIYKISFYHSIGYYVGFKLILAIDQDFDIIGFQIHKNCPNDSKLLFPFIEMLYKSKKIRSGDIILCDKGFTSKKNYLMLINRFCLIPIIYPRKNTNLDKIISNLNPPLEVFFTQKYKLHKWKYAVTIFKEKIHNWQNFKSIRSRIEDLFNIAKNCLDMKKIHQYTTLSVKKKVSRILFVSEKLISLCIDENIDLKALPFW